MCWHVCWHVFWHVCTSVRTCMRVRLLRLHELGWVTKGGVLRACVLGGVGGRAGGRVVE